jgi:hypothetical protein
MLLFTAFHVLAGVFVTHRALVHMLNTCKLTIASGRVCFRNGPVPPHGVLHVDVRDVEGFTAVATPKRSREGEPSFVLRVTLVDQTSRVLDLGVSDRASLEFAASRFNDELVRAKHRDLELPTMGMAYRGRKQS